MRRHQRHAIGLDIDTDAGGWYKALEEYVHRANQNSVRQNDTKDIFIWFICRVSAESMKYKVGRIKSQLNDQLMPC